MRFACTLIPALALALAATPAPAGDAGASYAGRTDVRAFAEELAQRRGWDLDGIVRTLESARLRPATQRLMMPAPAGQPKNWAAYRERFVEPRRILAGVAFWRDNAQALARAEERFGVPPEIVVGIIGVETFYGRVMGDFRVLDALATLSFDFPEGRSDRSAYFREELEAFLEMCRAQALDPQRVRGSYAGAMGLPQFMPGSVNRHAIDFDGDGRIDLAASAVDAVGSVARFLAAHGWQPGQPTHFAVTPPADAAARERLLEPDIVPSFDAEAFGRAGAWLPEAAHDHDGLLALVKVDNGGDEPGYVAGTLNFYVLTRYNRSSYYARAVIDLGAAVKASL